MLVAGVISAGLALRHFGPGLGLPFEVTKYGGSILWSAMVYGFAALVRPRASPAKVAMATFAFAVIIELSRLVHSPVLDAFRLNLVGATLLGRVFSLLNILAYGIGVLSMVIFDAGRFWLPRSPMRIRSAVVQWPWRSPP